MAHLRPMDPHTSGSFLCPRDDHPRVTAVCQKDGAITLTEVKVPGVRYRRRKEKQARWIHVGPTSVEYHFLASSPLFRFSHRLLLASFHHPLSLTLQL